MTSKIDRSENQLNNLAKRAVALLRWIKQELQSDEFALEQVLESEPLDDAIKPEEITAIEQRAKLRSSTFSSIESQNLVTKDKEGYVFTELGYKKVVRLAQERLAELFSAASYAGDRVRWSSIGGKPFGDERTEAQVVDDLLLQMFASRTFSLYGYFKKESHDGSDELLVLRERQGKRSRQLMTRVRLTGAFNWLKTQGLIESLGEEGIYAISLEGGQYLERNPE